MNRIGSYTTLVKEFPDIFNEMLSHNNQQQPLNLNKNRSMPHGNWEQYTSFGQGRYNRMRTLTISSPTIMHPNMANRFHHFSHSMPETLNTHNRNGHFTNHTYQASHTIGHAHHSTPFRVTKRVQEQQGIYHRRSHK